MAEPRKPSVYYVVFLTTSYRSIEEAKAHEPEFIAAHLARSKEMHDAGSLLMAGAFLDRREEALGTMAVLTSRQAAEEFVKGDPFVRNGKVTTWYIREWANTFT